MTAEEIVKEIENLNNSERIKLLDILFNKYFDNRPPKEVVQRMKFSDMWGDDDLYEG